MDAHLYRNVSTPKWLQLDSEAFLSTVKVNKVSSKQKKIQWISSNAAIAWKQSFDYCRL